MASLRFVFRLKRAGTHDAWWRCTRRHDALSAYGGRRWMTVETKFNLKDRIPEDLPTTKMSLIRKGPYNIGKITGMLLNNFSSTGEELGVHRLVTIGLSPFCEKARWALDISGVKYTEDAHPPFLNCYFCLPLTKGKSSQVPLLVLPSGEVLTDSTRIVQRLAADYENCRGLYPAHCKDKIIELEAYMHQSIGAAGRQVMYNKLLTEEYNDLVTSIMTAYTSRLERLIFPPIYRLLVRKGIRKVTKASDDNAALSLAQIRDAFARVSDMLSDGRTFIMGTQSLSAADLTFAALASPLLMPDNLRFIGPASERLPEDLRKLQQELRATKAGLHAINMYKLHRNRETVTPVSGPRDSWTWKGISACSGAGVLVALCAVSVLGGM